MPNLQRNDLLAQDIVVLQRLASLSPQTSNYKLCWKPEMIVDVLLMLWPAGIPDFYLHSCLPSTPATPLRAGRLSSANSSPMKGSSPIQCDSPTKGSSSAVMGSSPMQGSPLNQRDLDVEYRASKRARFVFSLSTAAVVHHKSTQPPAAQRTTQGVQSQGLPTTPKQDRTAGQHVKEPSVEATPSSRKNRVPNSRAAVEQKTSGNPCVYQGTPTNQESVQPQHEQIPVLRAPQNSERRRVQSLSGTTSFPGPVAASFKSIEEELDDDFMRWRKQYMKREREEKKWANQELRRALRSGEWRRQQDQAMQVDPPKPARRADELSVSELKEVYKRATRRASTSAVSRFEPMPPTSN